MKPRSCYLSIYRYLTPRAAQGGFTLVEMIVAIFIFVVIISALIVSYRRYGDRVGLENAANLLALQLREAQTYAQAVHVAADGSYPSWGVFLSMGNPESVILFADISEDGRRGADLPGPPVGFYEDNGACGSPGTECHEETVLPHRVQISSLCTVDIGASACIAVNPVDILFNRPFGDIVMNGSDIVGTTTITLQSPLGSTRVVSMNTAGKIEVR